jgi:hypothetical protein
MEILARLLFVFWVAFFAKELESSADLGLKSLKISQNLYKTLKFYRNLYFNLEML